MLTLSGDFAATESSGGPIANGATEDMHIEAEDDRAGATEIEVKVDGSPFYRQSKPCSPLKCTLEGDMLFNPNQYTDGEHAIEVSARDARGNQTIRAWKFDVESLEESRPGSEADTTAPDQPAAADSNTMQCEQPGTAPGFDYFSLGRAFEGLTASRAMRRCDDPFPGETVRADFVSYVYGDCHIPKPDGNEGGDSGCVPPVEIQSWPACTRSLIDLSQSIPAAVDGARETVRGVPSLNLTNDLRLELYTRATTIVLFASDSNQLLRAADAIRAETTTFPPSLPSLASATNGNLAPPVIGAMEGTLQCS